MSVTDLEGPSQQALLERVGERTLVDLFHDTCDAHPERQALAERVDDEVVTHSWREYRDLATAVAVGLRRLGLGRGDHLALMLTNRREHVIGDVATLLAGAVPTSVYLALPPEQLAHVARDCGATIAVVEDAAMLDRWLEIRDELEDLRTIVVVDPPSEGLDGDTISFEQLLDSGRDASPQELEELEEIRGSLRPGDAATLIYTSGTTGPPKGAVITHRNVLYQVEALSTVFDLRPGQRVISYLPLAHIAERAVSHYVAIANALSVRFVRDISLLLDALQTVRPQLLFGVPRVWEKMHARLLARIDGTENPVRRRLAQTALAVGQRQAALRLDDQPVPRLLALRHRALDALVLSKIRETLGVDEIDHVASGAAPLNPELMVFFAGLGLEVLDVYGLTESTAVVSCNRPGAARPGTVGPPLPGTEVRTAEDGEVLARGPHVFAGYHRREDATREVIDSEGWLHTGDLGSIDPDGCLTITGRKKDLIITAGGKNIPPSGVEDTVKLRSPIIAEACAVGDRRPYVAALIALDGEALAEWLASRGLPVTGVADASVTPEVLAEVERAVDEANAKLMRPSRVRRWAIVPNEWTVEGGEITPSNKMKRAVVLDRHAEIIEELYRGEG